jgi:kynurenine 3-monooxygenase
VKAQRDQPVNLVGAGMAGTLLAVVLAKRGFSLRIFERRQDPRRSESERGRSINLALAARGIRALERAGLMDRVRPLLIPMRGRMVHDRSGSTALHPYGQRDDEVVYSVGRAALNRVLLEAAAQLPAVTIRFGQNCLGADPSRNVLRFRGGVEQAEYEIPLTPAVATDGAGSPVRSSLSFGAHVQVREEFLDHDYKELTIPAVNGSPALHPHALHIWPRGGFMLIALPNTDGSFTATLFLARKGESSFASLAASDGAREFFQREFPDAVPLIPDLLAELHSHPQGQLGTVRTSPYHVGGQVLLLGDAAHAIVPFHGQGMNAAFEDCSVLDELLDTEQDWQSLFAAFSRNRLPDAEAIAQMALENYTEMRHTVLDSKYVRQRQLALELELRFPRRFIPRYAMVMFHPEIPYSEALRRGIIQTRILDQLDAVAHATDQLDLAMADRLISERLPPIG